MKTIKQPPAPKPVVKTCSKCLAELEIERDDCMHVDAESDGPVHHTPAHWTVKCPHCGDWMTITDKSWDDAPTPSPPRTGVRYGIPM